MSDGRPALPAFRTAVPHSATVRPVRDGPGGPYPAFADVTFHAPAPWVELATVYQDALGAGWWPVRVLWRLPEVGGPPMVRAVELLRP